MAAASVNLSLDLGSSGNDLLLWLHLLFVTKILLPDATQCLHYLLKLVKKKRSRLGILKMNDDGGAEEGDAEEREI